MGSNPQHCATALGLDTVGQRPIANEPPHDYTYCAKTNHPTGTLTLPAYKTKLT